MSNWEYHVIKLKTESGFFSGTEFDSDSLAEKLNEMGRQGWELVSIFGIEKVDGGSKYINAVLKRPCA